MLPKTVGLNSVTIQYLHHLLNGIMNFLSDSKSANLSRNFEKPFLLPSDKLVIEAVGWCVNYTLMLDILPALENMEAL